MGAWIAAGSALPVDPDEAQLRGVQPQGDTAAQAVLGQQSGAANGLGEAQLDGHQCVVALVVNDADGALLAQWDGEVEGSDGSTVTFAAFMILAVTLICSRLPKLNGWWVLLGLTLSEGGAAALY